ncbi:MAG: saccharopine dehydrogenase NADP-binding domain-containing protein [Bacteroidia bacterium]|nr:saccharopine dehydrogenase NADP-binding domain-containing protein [Bacteroidia bacterium]
MKKNVLILGAGMVAKPIIRYLLERNIFVTVADIIKSKADEIIAGHPNGRAIFWTADDHDTLDKLVAEHDLCVSLLPYAYHLIVAMPCLKHRKNMVTTSYVKPEMQALDTQAKEAGIIILNELGLDPGIDHMSAMRIIYHIHNKGGKVEELYSFCGALVAPDVEKNPFNYKFTWAPKGVVMAGRNDGRYLRHGKEVYIRTEDLFKNPLKVDFPNIGMLEVYPNRDSIPYIQLYNIPETKTMFRGTFRYEPWCENMDAIKGLNLLSDEKIDMKGKTYADLVAHLIHETDSSNIRQKVAKHLHTGPNSRILDAIEWTGIFDNKPIEREQDSPFEIFSDLIINKMTIKNNEHDMIVMQHTFLASYPDGKKEVIKSRMLDFGTPATDTSIARTVALPAAVGVKMILENKISSKGVHIPVIPEIYNPILSSLEELGIRMLEEYGLPETETIK